MEDTKSGSAWKGVVWVVVIALVIWGLASWGGTTKTEAGPIRIGFVGPLSGDGANIGTNAKAAVEVAVEEINTGGGINGRQLEVIYEDGECNGPAAANAANKLINIDKVPVILGGACSGETMAFAGAAEQSKTTVLSYCSSAPSVTQAGDFIFRNYPSDLYQGVYAADFAVDKLGKKKVAILTVKTDWGEGLKKVFAEEFIKKGGEVVFSEGYEQTVKDFRTSLTKIKAFTPDLIYFVGYAEASIPVIKQAKELGFKSTFLGADGWDDVKIWSEAGSAGDGAMYTVVSAPLNDSFKAKMKEKVGDDSIAVCSPTAYDGAKILAKVISEVGTDSVKIKDALYKVTYEGGVSGAKIQFDSNGDPLTASYAIKISNGGKAEVLK